MERGRIQSTGKRLALKHDRIYTEPGWYIWCWEHMELAYDSLFFPENQEIISFFWEERRVCWKRMEKSWNSSCKWRISWPKRCNNLSDPIEGILLCKFFRRHIAFLGLVLEAARWLSYRKQCNYQVTCMLAVVQWHNIYYRPGARLLGLKSQCYHLSLIWLWKSYLNSAYFGFLISKIMAIDKVSVRVKVS